MALSLRPGAMRRGSATACTCLALLAIAPSAPAASVERVSVDWRGGEAPTRASAATISGDGRFVAFSSVSPLVEGDRTGGRDVFLRDRRRGTTTLISATPSGRVPSGPSFDPVISADGRFVAFVSESPDLVQEDPNGGEPDVFIHDRVSGTTERVRMKPPRRPSETWTTSGPSISADGRFVAFSAVRRGHGFHDYFELRPYQVYVLDRRRDRISRISESSRGTRGDDDSGAASISADGRFVAFHSWAANLVRGDTYGNPDVFVRDRVRQTTARVSVGDGGAQADGPSGLPAISGSGRYVAFMSEAPSLVGTESGRPYQVFVRDRRKARTIHVSAGLRGWATLPAIAGRRVAFHLAPTGMLDDLDGPWGDVYVRDLGEPAPRRVTTDGRSGFPALAADGRHLAFPSTSALVAGDTNGVADLYVRRP